MLNIDIGINELAECIHYEIPHIVIRAQVQKSQNKTQNILQGKLIRVEEYASILLKKAGWSVFKGEDAHFFFSMLSYNFKNSFFFEVCRNWIGITFEERIARLEAAVSKSIANKELDPSLIQEALDMLLSYYLTYPRKKNVHAAIADYAHSFDQNLLLRLLKFYRKSGYKTKGAPDLFVVKNKSFLFIEVKSYSDSLSSAQYEFFEGYLTSVGKNIYVMRVLAEQNTNI